MRQIIIYAAACVLLIVYCVARAIAKPGTFGIELFIFPVIFLWGVALTYRTNGEK